MSRTWFGAAVLAAVAVLGACKDGTGPRHGDAARIEVIAGSGQQGTAGQPLPQPVQVRVADAAGRPVPDEVVNFVVTSGGGSVSAPSVLTDDDGVASAAWTLGTSAAAAQTLEARIGAGGGQTIVSDPVTATARAGAPVRMEAVIDTVLGGVAGSVLLDTLAVRVLDAHGNPVPGAAVGWTVAPGGSVTPLSPQTDAQGIARALWTLGADGTAAYTATASGPAGTVRFRAGAATQMLFFDEAGDMAPAGSGNGVRVVLRNAAGPVPGVRVRWLVTAGGGSAPAFSRTDANGWATAVWTYGSASAQQGLTAAAGSLGLTFSGTATTPGNRVPVVQVPGDVLDADETRLVWRGEISTGVFGVWLRQRGSTTDVKIADGAVSARLFPGGVLLRRGGAVTGELLVWKNGTLGSLGPVVRYVVDGEWAAWTTGESSAHIVRRNLLAGGTDTIAPTFLYSLQDVGPTGDVATITSPGNVLRIFSGETSRDVASGVHFAEIDGADVVYHTSSGSGSDPESVWREQAGDELLLASPVRRAMYAGGWLGFTRRVAGTQTSSNLFRRTPAGAVEQLTFDRWTKQLEAVGPTGWVVFRAERGTALFEVPDHRFLSVPGRPLVIDAGPAEREDVERVVWRTDRFLLLSRGFVYELTP
jgi:hypothetical protein